MKSLSFKKVSNGQSDIQITIKYVTIFLQIIIRSKKKIDVKLNKTLKLKFMLMFFDSVYPARHSDTLIKYTIYPSILFVEILFKWSWVLFCYFILGLPELVSKMPCNTPWYQNGAIL